MKKHMVTETSVRGYSIWLLPEAPLSHALSEVIAVFSQTCLTPDFKPHITLLGQIQKQESDILGGFELLANSLQPFRVHLNHPEHQDNIFRSLYLKVAPEEPLRQMYREALALFGQEGDIRAFLPHVSLLYGQLDIDRKQALINESPPLDFEGELDRITLMKTEGHPDHWQQIVEVKLG